MNYAYMVRCADGTLYTGWTNCLEKRLKAHKLLLFLCKGGPPPYMTAVLPFSIKSNRPETYISHTGHIPGKEKAGRIIPIADFAFPPALLYVLFPIL